MLSSVYRCVIYLSCMCNDERKHTQKTLWVGKKYIPFNVTMIKASIQEQLFQCDTDLKLFKIKKLLFTNENGSEFQWADMEPCQ